MLIYNNSGNTLTQDEAGFAVEDTASITKIFIADKNNNQLTLSRSGPGPWMIDGKYLAHDVKISTLLKTIKEIKVRAPVPVSARNGVMSRMAVLGKKVEVYQVVPAIDIFGWITLFPSEKRTRTYYVGDVTQDNQGTYMLMEGSDDPYVIYLPGLRGFVTARYSPFAHEWRDHTVFKTRFKDIRSVQVEFPWEPFKSFRVDSYDDNRVTLTPLADDMPVTEYDTARMLSFLTAFMDIRFESVLNGQLEDDFIDSVMASKPSSIITLTEKDGKETLVRTFFKGGFSHLYAGDGTTLEPYDLDRAYARLNDGDDFVLIQYFVFDRLLVPLQYFTHQEEE